MEFDKEDSVISEFLKSIGPWHNHVVIGGGYALIIYKIYLADQKLTRHPVGTRDIDSLIPRKVQESSQKTIAKHLQEAGFVHVIKDRDEPPTEAYVKEIEGDDVEVEFLTDTRTRIDKNQNVRISGVVAQPLSYLELSLATTKEFQTYSHETGRVVSPEAWIFHKGLTFIKRQNLSKTLKDLYGIWYVASQLGDFSEQALAEFSVLRQKHPKWSQTFMKNLRDWIKDASPSDWSGLEAQEPTGGLKKLNFERVIQKLLTLPDQYANTLTPGCQKDSPPSLAAIIVGMKGSQLIEKVREAIAAGADVNDISRNGHRPLQVALGRGYTDEVALLLIEHGADLSSRDRSRMTPLQTAINYGQIQNAKLLINKVVSFNRHNLNLEFDPIKFYFYQISK